ncbi:MAG: HAMP domain-containing histidine kinase [Proteobacteria bacterium]|nr:HAMP domain-containing histidine kinase [Pseudomonadota bacterium]
MGALVAAVSFLHVIAQGGPHYYRAFLGELYFVPLVLAGMWFGMRGALTASLAITAFFLPFTWATWSPVPPHGVEHLLEVLVFNGVALLLGFLRSRQAAAQERAREAQTLATMGEAVAAAAHDMRAPLTAIGGFATLASRELPEESQGRKHLAVVSQEVRRLEILTENMLDFSRTLELDRHPEDLPGVVARSIAVAEPSAAKRAVRLVTQATAEPPPLYVDSVRLEQALINLIQNAVEASPEGATVTVCTAQKGSTVLIEVVDSGPGIPPEKMEDLFRPFVTTKRTGTGLGLPIALKIVEAHGGRLDLLNNPEQGLRARIALPVS